ncbi:MAG: glyoxalase [Spirochaetes bacterium RBG_13_68_11]|nr:MAG: glyoxalase [Spirochaetes bacterium RBG_13_68_11]
MPARITYVHTNIVARDWRKLAGFYTRVFGCTLKPPERNLSGDWLDGLTSLRNAHVRGVHLRLPGYGSAGPTLEIFEYSPQKDAGPSGINRPGFAHIAFSVPDVQKALLNVKHNGGSSVGTLVAASIEGVGMIDVVYARDPEGNIIELQKWDRGAR